jgi:adenylate kinase
VAGVCNDCGVALVQRADDSAETVTARLVVYHKDTERLIPYYHARGILVRVEGGGEVKGVFGRITEALGKVCK